jgi:hypothetical protein
VGEYRAGPVQLVASGYNLAYDEKWNRIWKLTRAEIEYHQSHWWTAGYVPVENIANWPGNGDASLGQSQIIAPFFDNNNNQLYEPMQGDYPLIRGDECLFFVFNDHRWPHMETGGRKIGAEIHGMAYAFNCAEDSALYKATFLHYEVINRSDTVYDSTYFGFFVDTDLGYAWDDYIQCDVGRGAFYTYNSHKIDGNGLPTHYGAFPPVQAVVTLGGPFLDADGSDDPAYNPLSLANCGPAVNGLNFGDGISDNERFGMTAFSYFTNCSSGPICDPRNDADVYRFLNSTWKDNVHMRYGGLGHPNAMAYGPDCRFMFPGLSDPCNWGTNGIQPAGYITGTGGNGILWTEDSIHNTPDDRRGLAIMGPFTFNPNQPEIIDLAFVFARNYTDSSARAAVPVMNTYIDSIRSYFRNDYTPCGGNFSGIQATKAPVQGITIFPNPATQYINVLCFELGTITNYTVYDIRGTMLKAGQLAGGVPGRISLAGFAGGIYVLSATDGHRVVTRKFVVLPF